MNIKPKENIKMFTLAWRNFVETLKCSSGSENNEVFYPDLFMPPELSKYTILYTCKMKLLFTIHV